MRNIINKVNTFITRSIIGEKSYYSKDYYYKNLLDKYEDGQFYCNLKNSLKNLHIKKTDTDIQVFDGKTFTEIKLKDIVRKYGKPNYNFKYEELFGIRILIYRRQLGGHKTRIEFHFYQNHLIFYSYNFPYVIPESRKQILQVLREKYKIEEANEFKDAYIIDKNKNVIIPNSNLGLSLDYFCIENISFKEVLKNIHEQKVSINLLEERNRKVLFKRL